MRKSKFMAWLLAAALCIGMIPVSAFADENGIAPDETAAEQSIVEDNAGEKEINADEPLDVSDIPKEALLETGTEEEPISEEEEYSSEFPEVSGVEPGGSTFDFRDEKVKNRLLEAAEQYPDYYDLRHVQTENGEVSYVTPVRLQNPYGTCWGFAAIAAAESSLLSSGLAQKYGYDVKTLDLSEKQTAYFATSHVEDPNNSQYPEGCYFQDVPADQQASSAYRYNTGGYTFLATSLFASGIGPVSEEADPIFKYSGKRGEMTYREAATRYDDNNKPIEDSYEDVPVWYSNQDDWSIPEEYRFWQSYRLKDSIIMPDPAGYDENWQYKYQPEAVAAIKQQIVEYHRAVSINFCAESYIPGQDTNGKKYMSDKWAHYTNTQQFSKHSVTIVGYDDNYPRENFDSTTESGGSAQPEGNGAFLIKNSWGSELNEFPTNGLRHWGLLEGLDGVPYDPDAKAAPGNRATGYFWISYYDQSLNDPEAFVFEDDLTENGYYVEQMDCTHCPYLLDCPADDNRMANVFSSEATSTLNEFSVMTGWPGTTVEYAVYLLGEGYEDPEDGILIETGKHTFEYGGYHRINLKQPTVLTKGQLFSIVVRCSDSDCDYVCFAADFLQGYTNLYTLSVINKGESFYHNGTQWYDESEEETKNELLYYYPGYDLTIDNFPIKAYLEPVIVQDGEHASILNGYLTVNNWSDGNTGTYSFKYGDTKTLTAEFRGTDQTMPASWKPVFTWKSCDEDILSVSTSTPRRGNAVLEGKKAGTAKLIVSAGDSQDPARYGTRVLTIKVGQSLLASAEFEDPEDPTYTGKPFEPPIVYVAADNGKTDLVEDVDYTVTYKNNVNAGTAQVVISGIGNYTGELTGSFTINPAANTLKVKGKTAKVKYSALKKKNQTIPVADAITFTDKGQGTKTFAKISGNKNITINEKTGKITVAKGLKKNDYTIKVSVTAKGNKNYKAVTKKVKITIRVK